MQYRPLGPEVYNRYLTKQKPVILRAVFTTIGFVSTLKDIRWIVCDYVVADKHERVLSKLRHKRINGCLGRD